jgi:hypothetical protein
LLDETSIDPIFVNIFKLLEIMRFLGDFNFGNMRKPHGLSQMSIRDISTIINIFSRKTDLPNTLCGEMLVRTNISQFFEKFTDIYIPSETLKCSARLIGLKKRNHNASNAYYIKGGLE